MIPSFPKLLVDFGRQFIWSPLTVTVKRDHHKSDAIVCEEANSTFYCEGEPHNEDTSGSIQCLGSQHNQPSVHELTTSDKKCLSTCCAHYPNCDHFIIDTINTKSISSDIRVKGKSLSAPNLTINSDLYVNTFINKNNVCDSQKSVTSAIFNACITLDEIESVRSNPCDLLHEIDWLNSKRNACVTDSDHAIDEVNSSNFLFPINNGITSELCHHSLTDENKSISELVVLRENVLTMSTRSLCDQKQNETNDQMLNKLIPEMDQSVILNDYFDSDKCESSSSKTSLLSDRKNVVSISSRNSRRLIVNDKRLRNVVLDRIKRLTRSQSQGRSDVNSASNLSSRAFVTRTKGFFYRNVKRRFSSTHTCVDEEATNISIDDSCLTTSSNSKINIDSMDTALHDTIDSSTVTLRHCSSYESIEDSGCGSSIQTSSLSTDSNRSSICTGDDMNSYPSSLFRGPFISHAKAITDCTPCPYYKDALAFKRGDIISIIAKEDSGTWIGMTNGKIGHFKFVNVEEIKCSDRRKTCKLNPFYSATIEKETQAETHYYSSDDQSESSIYDSLKSRLNESNGTLNLTDVMQVIGLSDSMYSNILSINGYNDLKSLSEIGNEDILNQIGISDRRIQYVLLKSAKMIRDYLRDYLRVNLRKSSFKCDTSSQKLPKRRELITQSAPTTPAIELSTDFSELMSRLESVSTSSLENNYDEIQHFASVSTNLMRKNSQSSVSSAQEFCDSIENSYHNDDQTIYENNDQIIVVTHEQNSGTLDISQKTKSNNSTINKYNRNRNSLQFGIRDKSLDRNLLRKLDLKPIYMKDKNTSDLSRGITGSKSVMDLRTTSANCNNNDNSNLPIDTLRTKKRLKKLISSSRKFSSFTSHSSLVSLANNSSSNTTANIISNSLLEAIEMKLNLENIDLTEEPYSDIAGFCGIPPALIQRYTDECQRDIYEIAEVLDNLRMRSLQQKDRRGIPNDYLGDSCIGPVIDLANYENLHLWLISLGLPMYEKCLINNGFQSLYRVSKLRESDITNKCGIKDRRHVRILSNAISALHLSFTEFDKS